jgi:hypothetical protein
MAGEKTEELVVDDGFSEDAVPAESEGEEVSKASSSKNSLIKRRELDDLLEERKLQRRLREYDYDDDKSDNGQ